VAAEDGRGADPSSAVGPDGGWPRGLRDAFDRYERALLDDDVAVLDASFEPGPDTIRADAAGLLVGHDAISAFRSARGGVPARRIGRTEVRPLGDGIALVVAVSHVASGGQGLQTQLWRERGGTWRIAAAHVTARPAAFDPSIWRVVGAPLVRGADGVDLPLAGVRVAVKDLFAVRGHVVGAGNPTWERAATPEGDHAPAVRALLDAGASVTGIARTDEFAYSIAGRNAHTGAPPNGAVPERMPGGSTSGAAAAVALGQADLALGTDTAGSVRVPASYQGLWGLRTTHGAVPRTGLLPLARSFDTVGWLARDAATVRAAAVASIPHRAEVLLDRSAIVVAPSLLAAADPATRSVFRAWLVSAGIEPVEVDLPPLDDLAETVRVVQGAEAWRNDGAWVAAHRDALGADVLARFDAAAAITTATEESARTRLAELRTAVREALDGRVLCLPTVPGPAPLRTADADEVQVTRAATLRMTAVAGIGGLPAVSAPFLTVAGAPVGVCFVGALGQDVALLDLATSLG
jgi:amidase